MKNHLKNQSSPYLLQHVQNPVDWYPWCQEAFERAAGEDKPVFLSIGYSTCHWCHVMARESFENQEIAEILNRDFISIKVDREERPDIDSVYMTFCQAFTGRGGWPMSIFMTAGQKPFFAGTYFPAESRGGMIGFRDLLLTVSDKWKKDQSSLLDTAREVVDSVKEYEETEQQVLQKERDKGKDGIDPLLPQKAAKSFSRSFDGRYGGYGTAPKFPMPHNLVFLMLYSHLEKESYYLKQVEVTLENMRRGGIFDQIGYGFSRYSTDARFLVPHFEKMLYDNALLILAYALAYKATGRKIFLQTAEQTGEYILREMMGEEGGFFSAQDADSEGEEGRFYLWTCEEICRVLGKKKGKQFCDYYNMTEEGNFQGKNIPNLLEGNEIVDQFREEREKLYRHRRKRMKLHLDKKVLTSWNALMVVALAMLYRVSGRRQYLEAARGGAEFIEKYLSEDKFLYVSFCDGVRSQKGFLDEYACAAWAFLSLYEAASEKTDLERAQSICREAVEQFWDKEEGGFFLYGKYNEELITKPKECYDGALPSGNSVMAYCLVRLSQIADSDALREMAENQLRFLSRETQDTPEGSCLFLVALLSYLQPPQRITVVLAQGENRERILSGLPVYADIVIYEQETEEYRRLNDRTTYYVCRDHACLPPSNFFFWQ